MAPVNIVKQIKIGSPQESDQVPFQAAFQIQFAGFVIHWFDKLPRKPGMSRRSVDSSAQVGRQEDHRFYSAPATYPSS